MKTIKIPDRPAGLKYAGMRALSPEFAVNAQEDTTELVIYDEIGFFGVSADDVRRKLDSITTPNIDLRINSPGGDVFDGIAIFNDLFQHDARVKVNITGLAASAASVIAMAGNEIKIAESAFLMIHNAWALAIGDRNTMEQMSGILGKIDQSIARTYANRTGGSVAEMATLMDDETWMDGPEAVEAGFADDVTSEESVSALFDLSAFKNTPDRLKRQVEAGLREAGYSRKQARDAASAGFHCLGQREAVPPNQREAGVSQRDADDTNLAELIRQTSERIRAHAN